MSGPSASVFATRLRQKIARRQRVARWSKWLALPTVAAIFYFGRSHERFAIGAAALFLLETLAIMHGEAQRCPVCEAPLVTGRGFGEEFEGTCPECGCPID